MNKNEGRKRMAPDEPKRSLNFIEQIVEHDLETGRWKGKVHTRFPPEPNGYLHIGHAKSICLNFGLAQKYGGTCNLRFDDTNPIKEEQEYIDSIVHDVRWLGFQWHGARQDDPLAGVCFSSDYFQRMYEWAVELIRKGKAYVCDLTADQTRQYRGTLTRPGTDSPHRNRTVDENLDLFERMRRGEFPDGSRTLRAKIDMAHPNLNMRDPVMVRILHARHPHTGEDWCIYPMYDWAHGLEDSIEGITHSICTLEFENHRPLYDWFIDAINDERTPDGTGPYGKPIHHPQQIEFARLELTYTIMSKRKLLELVQTGIVRGWDDPRMPTLSGMRRRGYTAAAIRNFCARIGVAKFNSTVDIQKLEHAVREDLNTNAPRVMAVLNPLKVVITNWTPPDADDTANVKSLTESRTDTQPDTPDANTSPADWLDAVNNPEDPSAGTRKIPFSGTIYIERDDFLEDPPRKFFRLAPGREVRLRYAYFITCNEVIKDDTGRIIELRCTYDPATRGGDSPDGRKVKATLHWVSADHALDAETRLYDRLFTVEKPGTTDPATERPDLEHTDSDTAAAAQTPRDWKSNINPNSLTTTTCKIEPSVRGAAPGTIYQFERVGYFCVDPDTTPDNLVFNRTVPLKDAWAKIQKKQKQQSHK